MTERRIFNAVRSAVGAPPNDDLTSPWLEMGTVLGFMERDDMRAKVIAALRDRTIDRAYIERLRDRLDEVLIATGDT